MCEGGEGGIREVEKEDGGDSFMHSMRGENWEFWESWFTVGFTVHRGGLKRFWARRARTSIDVLGLGVLVGRVAGFGVS
jgi:hypothetical protein